jgi:hypothetical protein
MARNLGNSGLHVESGILDFPALDLRGPTGGPG